MLLSSSRDPVGTGQRDTGHGSRLDGQGDQVFLFQVMDIGFSAGSGERAQFHGEHLQVIAQLTGSMCRIQSFLEDCILRGNTDRALASMAVVAETRLRVELPVVFRGITPLLILEVGCLLYTSPSPRD